MDATLRRRRSSAHIVRPVAVAAAIGAIVEAGFQAALAVGAPFGRASWGGQPTHLATDLRVASGIVAFVWLFVAAVILKRGGFDVRGMSTTLAYRATWVIFAFLALGTVMNLASQSALERAIWTPFTLVLAILTFVIARSEQTRTPR